MEDFVIRPATPADAELIARHRVIMFREMGKLRSEGLAPTLQSASAIALRESLRNRSYIGWLATDGRGEVIGGAGAHIKPQLPRPSEDGSSVVTAPVPLVVNVYTEPGWRRRGVARALMGRLLAWAQDSGFDRVLLHASDDGRPLYASLGFTTTNEMRWSPCGDDRTR